MTAGRVLLVGEPDNELTELKMNLQRLGLTVEAVPDGLAGLERGPEFQPDLVVTEILMNRLSGFELSSRISKGTAGFSAPVILYTEFYRDEKARREVLNKYGALQYFVKPFQKDALKKAITRHFHDFLAQAASKTAEARREATAAMSSTPEFVEPQLSRTAAANEKDLSLSRGVGIVEASPAGCQTRMEREMGVFPHGDPDSMRNTAEAKTLVPGQGTPEPAAEESSGRSSRATAMRRESVAERPRPVAGNEKIPSKGTSDLTFTLVPQPPATGRLKSIGFWVAAVVVVVLLGLYLSRGWLQKEQSLSELQRDSSLPVPADPTPQVSEIGSEPVPLSKPEDSPLLADEPPSRASNSASSEPQARGRNLAEASDPDRAEAVIISDVTGGGKGPYLRRMKRPDFPSALIRSLRSKAIVVRIVVNESGKVVDVTPLDHDGTRPVLPSSALAAIREWQFGATQSKDPEAAVKYYSFKVRQRP